MGELLGAIRTSPHRRRRAILLALACLVAILATLPFPARALAASGKLPVYRLLNPYEEDKHLYTSSVDERDALVELGWVPEGTGWVAPRESEEPIYRLYNPYSHEHLYTTDRAEYDALEEAGWNGEGEKFHSYEEETVEETGVPVYRLYNPYAGQGSPSSHHFTTSGTERDELVRAGWDDEGVAWYARKDLGTDHLALGSFFVDTEPAEDPYGRETDFATVLCATYDGYNFIELGTPFTNLENPFHDPSIVYHDGSFYLLSNWNRQNGRFNPMVSYSADLVTWSEPEGGPLINDGDYEGIPLESDPFDIEDFDVVAPEWFQDEDGSLYILFSAGRFGAFHGEPERDRMKPYLVEVEISHGGLTPWTAVSGKPFPVDLELTFTEAFEIKGLDESENFIDGSLYKEDGVYYLLIKKDGFINQVYRNESLEAEGWELVADGLAVGNEGPSLVRLDDEYLLYTDMIATFPGHDGREGVQVCQSRGVEREFGEPCDVVCDEVLRHGTVIPLEGEARDACERLIGSS